MVAVVDAPEARKKTVIETRDYPTRSLLHNIRFWLSKSVTLRPVAATGSRVLGWQLSPRVFQ
jgi:hypothetical protein